MGLTAFGGAAFLVGAPVEIRPIDRPRLFPKMPLVFEMNDVEDVLPLLLRQEPEHGDEIGLKARERAPVTKEPLLLLHASEIEFSTRSALRLELSENEVIQRSAHKASDRRELVEARALIVPSFDCTMTKTQLADTIGTSPQYLT